MFSNIKSKIISLDYNVIDILMLVLNVISFYYNCKGNIKVYNLLMYLKTI